MKHSVTMGAAALAVALLAGPVFAQTTGGSALDPNSENNRQPAIGNNLPTATDPAAGDNPEARVPTAPQRIPGSDAGDGTSVYGYSSDEVAPPADDGAAPAEAAPDGSATDEAAPSDATPPDTE